jgi:glutamyl-tRNA reductase
VSATEAPHYTVERSSFRKIFPEAPHFLLDLGVPRNIDPQIGELESVRLFTLEDLQNVAKENRHHRLQELEQVERFIDEAVEAFRFSLYWNTLVQALQEDFQEITREELQRLFGETALLAESQMVPIKETLQRINRRFFAHLKNVLKDGMDGVWRREKESCPGR